jgi:hypothetical protein
MNIENWPRKQEPLVEILARLVFFGDDLIFHCFSDVILTCRKLFVYNTALITR